MNEIGIKFVKRINEEWNLIRKIDGPFFRNYVKHIDELKPEDSEVIERMMRLGIENKLYKPEEQELSGLAIATLKEGVIKLHKK